MVPPAGTSALLVRARVRGVVRVRARAQSATAGRTEQGKSTWARRSTINGNRNDPRTKDLTDGLALQRTLDRAEESQTARPADPYQLSVDVERIRAAYQEIGYFEVDVKGEIAHRDETDKLAQTVVFTIKEGRRAKAIIVIDGLPPEVSQVTARGVIELKEGMPFDYDMYDDAKEPLLALVQDAGYARADLQAEVLADKAHAQATVRYVFDPGPKCTFGALNFAGVSGQLADAIVRRTRFNRGARRYSQEQDHEDAERSIYQIGRFSSVRIEPDRSGDGTVIPVKITVVMASRYESKLGGGFGTEPLTYEVRARAAISAAGIPGELWNAALDVRPAYTVDHSFGNPEPKVKLLATLSRMDLFALIKGTLELGYDYLVYEAYTSAGAHSRISFGGPLGVEWINAQVGWFFEQLAFPSVNNNLVTMDQPLVHALGLDTDERVGRFEAAISFSTGRDDPLDAHSGWYLDLHGAVRDEVRRESLFTRTSSCGRRRGCTSRPEKLVEQFGLRVRRPGWGNSRLAARLRVDAHDPR